MAQAEASLVKAEQDVARVQPLVAENALPEQDLDQVTANQRIAQNDFRAREANVNQLRLTQTTSIQQAEAAIQAAKAALELAELNLGFTEIRAPAARSATPRRLKFGISSPEPDTTGPLAST